MYHNNVLLLCPLDNYNCDIGWHSYPHKGFIQDDKFTLDDNLENGFTGFLWGKITFPWKQKVNKWAVAKTTTGQHLIKISVDPYLYKFKYGLVIERGSLKQCLDMIESQKNRFEEYSSGAIGVAL